MLPLLSSVYLDRPYLLNEIRSCREICTLLRLVDSLVALRQSWVSEVWALVDEVLNEVLGEMNPYSLGLSSE